MAAKRFPASMVFGDPIEVVDRSHEPLATARRDNPIQIQPTASTSKAGELEELVECPICLETLKDPKILICHHTFCQTCLEHVNSVEIRATDRRMLKCPVCSRRTVLRPDGIEGLQNDFRANKLLDAISSKRARIETEKKETKRRPAECEVCGGRAKYGCINCEMRMCMKCKMDHVGEQFGTGSEHFIIMLGKKSFCTHHPKRLVVLYCRSCEAWLCSICSHSHDKDHEGVRITKSKSYGEDLAKEEQWLNGQVNRLQKQKHQLQITEEAMLALVKAYKNEIKKEAEHSISKINAAKKKSLANIENLHQRLSADRQANCSVDEYLTIFKRYLTEVNQLKSDSMFPYECIPAYSPLKSRLEMAKSPDYIRDLPNQGPEWQKLKGALSAIMLTFVDEMKDSYLPEEIPDFSSDGEKTPSPTRE